MKVFQLGFLMVRASRFIPYVFMFFPDMLPSPFRPDADGGSVGGVKVVGGKWDAISRERSHAVVSTLLAMERDARVPSKLLNLNPFGKAGSRRLMVKLDDLGRQGAALLTTEGLNWINGAEAIVDVLRDQIFTLAPDEVEGQKRKRKDKTGIKMVPKILVRGVARAIDAPNFNSIYPTFFLRGKIVNHLQSLSVSDEFLVSNNVNLETLSGDVLIEACNIRLIGGPGRSEEKLREGLESWLKLVVKEPTVVVDQTDGLDYNANLARFALLCYHAVDGARAAGSSSFTTRALFQGQLQLGKQQRQEMLLDMPNSDNSSVDQIK